MQILWHSQIALTMEIYSEVPTARTRSALEQLSRQLDGQPTLLYEDLNGPIPYSESALDVELRGFEPLTPSMRTPGGEVARGRWGRPATGRGRTKSPTADDVAVLVCCTTSCLALLASPGGQVAADPDDRPSDSDADPRLPSF